MKNFAKILTAMLLAILMAFSMVACSTYGKVQKALNKIGYVVLQSDDQAEEVEEESDVDEVEAYVFSNANSLGLTEGYKLNIVLVFEFNATEDMMEFYKDSETLQGLVSDLQEDGSAKAFYDQLVAKGYANGNCLVISTNLTQAEAVKTAIKNA